MTTNTLTHQFLVLPDDDGIRPAGKPDECFYCQRKVGELHKDDCVMISQDCLAEAAFHLKGGAVILATMRCLIPLFWDKDGADFYFNQGSFCVDNLLNKDLDYNLVFRNSLEEDLVREYHRQKEGCLCGDTHITIKTLGGIPKRKNEGRKLEHV